MPEHRQTVHDMDEKTIHANHVNRSMPRSDNAIQLFPVKPIPMPNLENT